MSNFQAENDWLQSLLTGQEAPEAGKNGGWFTSGKPKTPGVEFMMSTQRQVSRGQEVVPSFANGVILKNVFFSVRTMRICVYIKYREIILEQSDTSTTLGCSNVPFMLEDAADQTAPVALPTPAVAPAPMVEVKVRDVIQKH